MPLNDRGRLRDQRALRRLVQHALAFGVGAAMADHLVAARPEGIHQLRAIAIDLAVHQHADRKIQRVEQFQHAPGADPVAIVAPGIIQHVGLRPARRQLRPQPLAKGEMLQVQRDIDRQPFFTRPAIVRPANNRHIVIAAMGREHSNLAMRMLRLRRIPKKKEHSS